MVTELFDNGRTMRFVPRCGHGPVRFFRVRSLDPAEPTRPRVTADRAPTMHIERSSPQHPRTDGSGTAQVEGDGALVDVPEPQLLAADEHEAFERLPPGTR